MNTDVGLVGDGDISRSVIGAAIRVTNALGVGFLEKVYENALALELRLTGHDVEQQRSVEVRYRGEIVGVYQVDLLVDSRLVVELKAVEALAPIHKAQCLNYLKATDLRIGLLINFGRPRLEIRRIIS